MTWDGQPEHRNLGGGHQPPKPLGDQLRDLSARIGRRPPPAPDPMPADPFGGMTAGATATHELFTSHVDAGFTEQQALFYLACLAQVGLAIQQGGLLGGSVPGLPEDEP